jgi:hypothetical protein
MSSWYRREDTSAYSSAACEVGQRESYHVFVLDYVIAWYLSVSFHLSFKSTYVELER